jgi:uncharacterized membrane protein HdeD (DUF308 family)
MASSIMSTMDPSPRLRWGWVLALGIAMILLGSIALGDTLAVTLISILLLGWLLIGAGLLHIIHLVRNTEARNLWHVLNVIVDLVAGFYFVSHPGLGAVTLTLVLAAFFLASGIMRLIAVFQADLPHKVWPIIDALISITLGAMLWIHWPWTGLWFIGFAVAIGLIFRGWGSVMIALAFRARNARQSGLSHPADLDSVNNQPNGLNSSSRALASIKSGVSKPSVNQL